MVMMNNESLKDNDDFWLQIESDIQDSSANLSDLILLQTIYDQIDKDLDNSISNNVLKIFDERFQYINLVYGNDPKIITPCKEIRRSVYTKILMKLAEKFNFDSELFTEEIYNNTEDLYYYTGNLYYFFVLNYKENLIQFFVNYVYINKDNILAEYKHEIEKINKTDLAFKALKKSLNCIEDAVLIYLIDKIILDYIEKPIPPEEIINNIVEIDEYEVVLNSAYELFVENKFNTYLRSDFNSVFFKPLKSDEFRYDLLIQIKYELMLLLKQEGETDGNKE